MKTAYKIVTPILALASVVLGFFLKMFYFTVGSADQQINGLLGALTQLSDKINTTFEYSLFELIKMAVKAEPQTGENAKTFTEIAQPVLGHFISFLVFFVLALFVMLAAGIVSTLKDSKKKRYTVLGLCGGGIVLLFVCILISNAAFAKIMNGDVNLTELVQLLSESAVAALATAILSVTRASLSAGFYSVFGIFIVIMLWTVLTNMLISTPIQKRKTYKRKKPMRKLTVSKK